MVYQWHTAFPSIMDANVKQDMGKLFSHKLSLVTQITWASISCLIHRFKKEKLTHNTCVIPGSPGASRTNPQNHRRIKAVGTAYILYVWKFFCEWWQSRWSETSKDSKVFRGGKGETWDYERSPNLDAVSGQELSTLAERFMGLPSLGKVRLAGCCWRHMRRC